MSRKVPKEWKPLYEWLKANSEEVAEELADGFFYIDGLYRRFRNRNYYNGR